jgi:hypothetical protein
MRSFLLFAIAVQICLSACAVRLADMSDNEKAERLAIEKGKLIESKDPVEIAKSHIMIARILLDFVSTAVRQGEVEGIDKRLAQYIGAVQAARDAMVTSGLDPMQRVAGYRDLEIATVEFTGILRDIKASSREDLQPSIDNAREITDSIQKEMHELLFPKPTGRRGDTTGARVALRLARYICGFPSRQFDRCCVGSSATDAHAPRYSKRNSTKTPRAADRTLAATNHPGMKTSARVARACKNETKPPSNPAPGTTKRNVRTRPPEISPAI